MHANLKASLTHLSMYWWVLEKMGMRPRRFINIVCLLALSSILLLGCASTSTLQDYVFKGKLSKASRLIKAGADVNSTNHIKGWTPLMAASQIGSFYMVKELLGKGADLHIKSTDGVDALYIASVNGNPRIVQLLLDRGSDPNATVPSGSLMGWTALIGTAASGRERISKKVTHSSRWESVRILIRSGADIDHKDAKGWTALMHAAKAGFYIVILDLIDHGANIDLVNNEGQTALVIANQNKRTTVAKALTKPRKDSTKEFAAANAVVADVYSAPATTSDANWYYLTTSSSRTAHEIECRPSNRTPTNFLTGKMKAGVFRKVDELVDADGKIIQSVITTKDGLKTLVFNKRERCEAAAKRIRKTKSNGKTPPSAQEDPGYPIGNCLHLRKDQEASTKHLIISGIGLPIAPKLICGNTIAGKKLLLDRKGKCGERADRKCVCGDWMNGRPQYNDPFGNLVEDGKVTVNMRRGTVVVARCTIPQSTAALPGKKELSNTPVTDLMKHPEFILSDAFSRDGVSVAGIKLGEPEDAIPRKQIKEEKTETDWRHLQSGAKFRVMDGVIVEMGIPKSRTKALGINSEAEISRAFGEPDRIEKVGASGIVLAKQYHYVRRGLIVNWAERLGGMTHITIYASDVCAGFNCP